MIPVESAVMRCVTAALKDNITEYFGKSQTVYPKINCDLRLIEENHLFARYRLTLDYYADDGDPITVVEMSEKTRRLLSGGQSWTAEEALILFNKDGTGGFAEEPDNEKIVHYMDAYEVKFFKNFE